MKKGLWLGAVLIILSLGACRIDCGLRYDGVIITGFEVETEYFTNQSFRHLPPYSLQFRFHLQTNFEEVFPQDVSWLPTVSLFPVAYATSCSYVMDEEVIWINVTSDADFNDDYPAGTHLNDLVYDRSRGIPIDRLMRNFGIGNFTPSSHFSLLIPEAPEEVMEHNLTFEIGLSSGNIITVSEAVNFTRLASINPAAPD